MLKGLIRDNELVHKAEWLETLSLHCGIGLWDAILYEGDAMHAKARWTWSSEFRRLCGYKTEAEFPNVADSFARASRLYYSHGNSITGMDRKRTR
ncbi:hypothetical protein GGD64_000572 [Bradyrhizobium sp. CIR3A]|nr:hypothetical protein [Bradyrhizobium sp. CIR3A]NYG43396.1 hypothetical protein [Bradyrhizobium sp. IAR9]